MSSSEITRTGEQPANPIDVLVTELHVHGDLSEALYAASGYLATETDLIIKHVRGLETKTTLVAAYLEEQEHSLQIALCKDVPTDRDERTAAIKTELLESIGTNPQSQEYDLFVNAISIFEEMALRETQDYLTRPADTYPIEGHSAAETAEQI